MSVHRLPRIPRVYRPGPMGPMPLHWMHESSGELSAAVQAYYDQALGKGQMTEEQIELVWDYIAHHINAPCWDEGCKDSFEGTLRRLREWADKRGGVRAIHDYIDLAIRIGIDPL